jgi:hypothetical protein
MNTYSAMIKNARFLSQLPSVACTILWKYFVQHNLNLFSVQCPCAMLSSNYSHTVQGHHRNGRNRQLPFRCGIFCLRASRCGSWQHPIRRENECDTNKNCATQHDPCGNENDFHLLPSLHNQDSPSNQQHRPANQI